MVVARWKSSRVISFPLTGLQNAAIVEYTAAKSDDLYRIDSGNGTRWDTRAFEISFGYRGWLLNVDGRCRIHLTNKVGRRVSILSFVTRIFMKYVKYTNVKVYVNFRNCRKYEKRFRD